MWIMSLRNTIATFFGSTKRQREMNINDLTNISWGWFQFQHAVGRGWKKNDYYIVFSKKFLNHFLLLLSSITLYFLILPIILSPNEINKIVLPFSWKSILSFHYTHLQQSLFSFYFLSLPDKIKMPFVTCVWIMFNS